MQTTFSLLKTFFGFDSFRPLQEEIVTHLINQQSCLVLMPTGGGKSVCFQVPALSMEGTALVISPLIALMKDQVQSLRSNGISAAFLNSSLSRDEENQVISDCLSGKLKLLYVSPERALTMTQDLLSQMKISLIAIDEAHCISQWGHDFRPEYTRLHSIRTLFPVTPVIALTATADKTTRKDILRQLGLEDAKIFISSFDRPNIRLEVKPGRKKKEQIQELVNFINRRHDTSGIIYCLSRKGTEAVAAELNARGIQCAFYHAGMENEERSRVQDAFIKDDIKIICATIAFGMGIDKSNIRWVVHYNLPSKLEGYYQEIGRAGRDGLKSDALLFYSVSDLMMLTRFADESGQPKLNREKLLRMQQYAEARMCRRKILLNYFGETMVQNCNNCDVCSSPPPVSDGTVAAQKALSAIVRTGEQTGITMLILILRGSSNKDLVEKGYDKIKTWGSGKEHSFETWQAYILQFIQAGLIEIAYDESFTLKVTDLGKEVLSGKLKVDITEPVRRFADEYDRGQDESEDADTPVDVLFEKLRTLRKNIARRENVAPYIIFTDKTLYEMATNIPLTANSMLAVQGVSQNKMQKYGMAFLELIQREATEDQKRLIVNPAAELHDENIAKWIRMLQELKIKTTASSLTKILIASDNVVQDPGVEKLPFYGLLKGIMRYTATAEIIRSYFLRHQPVVTSHPADSFFNAESFNTLPASVAEGLKSAITGLPVNRPVETIDNNYILEARKTFPRSYEHWLEPEVSIFKSVITQTNDLELIASIFQRSPDSIKAYYRKTQIVKEEVF